VIAFASLGCTLFVHYRYRRRKTGGGSAQGRGKKKNFIVGANGENGYGNHYSSNGAKRLLRLKYAPLPSDRLPPEQQLRPPCPRTVPNGGVPSTPNKQCFRRPPPPFSPPAVSRMSNVHRGDLILALEGDSRVMDTGPLTSDREQRYEEPWETTVKYRPLPHWFTSSPTDHAPPPPCFPPLPSFTAEPPAEPHYHQCPIVQPMSGLLNQETSPILTNYDTSGTSSLAYSSTKSCPAVANVNAVVMRRCMMGMGSQPIAQMKAQQPHSDFSPPPGAAIVRSKHDDSGLESV